jgi:hypothetical protein
MHLYDPPYALWSIWRQLSLLNRGLILVLAGVLVYSVFSTFRTLLRLRSVWNRPNESPTAVREEIVALATRHATVQQVIRTAFYLFGLVLFIGMESIANVLADGKQPLGVYVLENFLLLSAFAANVFFIFLVLHLIQWAGSGVLNSISRRLSRRHLALS